MTSWSILSFQATQTLPPMTKVLMCLFIVCETKFTIGESRTISHANETQAQQVQNLAQEDFPPKLL